MVLRAAVFLVFLLGCGDEPDFLEPNLGDFVQATTPSNGAVVSADKSSTISLFLNFFPAEGRFGFGALRSFRFDGEEVRESVQVFPAGGPPPVSAVLSYPRPDISTGEHEVQVEYVDSRGVLHRIRWSFTITG